jgi:hypothetical protein
LFFLELFPAFHFNLLFFKEKKQKDFSRSFGTIGARDVVYRREISILGKVALGVEAASFCEATAKQKI